jgi:hypothetical protein
VEGDQSENFTVSLFLCPFSGVEETDLGTVWEKQTWEPLVRDRAPARVSPIFIYRHIAMKMEMHVQRLSIGLDNINGSKMKGDS